MPTPPQSPLSPLWRFCRDWLGAIVLYPPAIAVAFWLLHSHFALDLFYSILFTPLVTPFIVVAELFAGLLLVIYPRLIASHFVVRFRRHPRIRPLYLRCRERAIQSGARM